MLVSRVVLVAVIGSMPAACSDRADTPPSPATGEAGSFPGDDASRWAVAESEPWSPTLRAYGVVSDTREVRITAPFTLRIVRADIDVGQRVEQGQVVGTFDAPMLSDLAARLDSRRQRAALVGTALDDVRDRQERHLATNEEMIRARSDLDAALADQDDAWHRLAQALVSLGQDVEREDVERMLAEGGARRIASSLSVIKAPFAGVVMERGAMPGVTLAAGAVLYTIEDVSSVYVDVAVSSGDVGDWQAGAVSAAVAGKQMPLQATDAVPRLDPDTGMTLLRYRGVVPDARQIDGARIRVVMTGASREVTWVPSSAVVSRDGVPWCIVDRGGGALEPARVTIGPEEGGRTPVLAGISPGDRVLVHDAYEVLYRDLNELIQFSE